MTKKTSREQSSHKILHTECGEFYESIADLLRTARSNAYRAVNFVMVEAYWNVGRMIVEEEQQGKERAEYGAALIKNLSVRLSEEFGKGVHETKCLANSAVLPHFSVRRPAKPKTARTACRIDVDALSASHAD
jgi:hypothetical protein